jgi:TRAP-type mannitol/chloroaromatic compound transport system permease small subunit
MQKIFENVLKNTDDELFKLINERISNNTLKLTNNLITNNEVNMFETTKLFLNMPIKYTIKMNEHVRKYNNF